MPPEAQHTSLGSYYHSRQREMIHSQQAAFFFSNFFPPAARWREEPLVTGYNLRANYDKTITSTTLSGKYIVTYVTM